MNVLAPPQSTNHIYKIPRSRMAGLATEFGKNIFKAIRHEFTGQGFIYRQGDVVPAFRAWFNTKGDYCQQYTGE